MAKKNKTKKQSPVTPKKKKSSGISGALTVFIIASLTVIIGIVILSRFGDRLFKPEKPSKEVSLFISDESGTYLKARTDKIEKGTLEEEITETVASLIKSGAGTVPAGTRVLGVKVDGAVATVDLSKEVIKNHPGGSTGELLTIYSIVDTITLNFQEIKEVQLLVEGSKEETLKGHIDMEFPLGPDKKIIK
ncbi:MAG: GerMN domain-containing protein [Deltaproteobacteria bacterium]|nr:GerMN domain-containing protein [Deltaproteobacteria bacterium]